MENPEGEEAELLIDLIREAGLRGENSNLTTMITRMELKNKMSIAIGKNKRKKNIGSLQEAISVPRAAFANLTPLYLFYSSTTVLLLIHLLHILSVNLNLSEKRTYHNESYALISSSITLSTSICISFNLLVSFASSGGLACPLSSIFK